MGLLADMAKKFDIGKQWNEDAHKEKRAVIPPNPNGVSLPDDTRQRLAHDLKTVHEQWEMHVRQVEAQRIRLKAQQQAEWEGAWNIESGGGYEVPTKSREPQVGDVRNYYDPIRGCNRTEVWSGSEWVDMAANAEYERYRDAEGRWFVRPKSKPENKIEATIHKAGHFPISWMIEAHERAMQSEKMITLQIEKEGVVVIGREGDEYEDHTLSWAAMEHAPTNPIILGIETVERHLSTLGRLKRRVAAA